MEKERIFEYMLANEKARYEAEKEKQKTLRHFFVVLISCLTIAFCFWVYFNTPYEVETHVVSDGSQYISGSSIEGGNLNGGSN